MKEAALKWLAIAAVIALGVWLLTRAYESHRAAIFSEGDQAGAGRVQALWDADKVKRAGETVAKVAAARKEEQDQAAAAAKGERDALTKAAATAAANRAAAGRAAAHADRLSGDIAALNAAARAADLPEAAACPAQFVEQRNAAIRAREVLGSCVAEYRQLAQDADAAGAAAQLKLDTALSYIHAVAPPH